jgi:hypothetical protein
MTSLAVSRLVRNIEEGQVSAKRAFEIFQSVQKGTGEIFKSSMSLSTAQAAQGIIAMPKLEKVKPHADQAKQLTLYKQRFRDTADEAQKSCT